MDHLSNYEYELWFEILFFLNTMSYFILSNTDAIFTNMLWSSHITMNYFQA